MKATFCSIFYPGCQAEKAYPYKLHQCVVDVGSLWEEEAATRAEIMEEKQVLFLETRNNNSVSVRLSAFETQRLTSCMRRRQKKKDNSHKKT